MKTLGKVAKTKRGFEMIEFEDCYGEKSSLQASSLAVDGLRPGCAAIWLGPDDPKPRILASAAASHGVKTDQSNGWIDYPMPREVLLSTRMHLTRDQVEALIGHLQNWLKHGTFKIK